MKKQLFSLVMMLALVVIAGSSAWAQTGDPDDPFYQINNSAHTFTITDNGNTMLWQVFTAAGTDVTADANHVINVSGTAGAVLGLTWAETAFGMYYAQITETTADGCQTIRRVYVFLIDFDVEVYVSNAAGVTRESATDYAACGEGTVANYGDDGPGNAFTQSVDVDGTGAGNLANAIGTSHRTNAYVSLAIHWNAPAAGTYGTDFTAPTISYITYDATVTFTGGLASDFISIGDYVGTPSAGLVTETTGTGTTTFTSTMVVNARWGLDQTIQVQAANVTLYNASDVVLGTELNGNEVANVQGPDTTAPYENTSDSQTILGAPATTIIIVN